MRYNAITFVERKREEFYTLFHSSATLDEGFAAGPN